MDSLKITFVKKHDNAEPTCIIVGYNKDKFGFIASVMDMKRSDGWVTILNEKIINNNILITEPIIMDLSDLMLKHRKMLKTHELLFKQNELRKELTELLYNDIVKIYSELENLKHKRTKISNINKSIGMFGKLIPETPTINEYCIKNKVDNILFNIYFDYMKFNVPPKACWAVYNINTQTFQLYDNPEIFMLSIKEMHTCYFKYLIIENGLLDNEVTPNGLIQINNKIENELRTCSEWNKEDTQKALNIFN